MSRYNPVNRQQVVNGGMSRVNYQMTNAPMVQGSLSLNGDILTLNGELTLNGMDEVDEYCEECLMNDVIPTEIGFLNGRAERKMRREKRRGKRAQRKADRESKREQKKADRYAQGKGRRMAQREQRQQARADRKSARILERKQRREGRQSERAARRAGRQGAFADFGESVAKVGSEAISKIGGEESPVKEYVTDFVQDEWQSFSENAPFDFVGDAGDDRGSSTTRGASLGSKRWFKKNSPWSYIGAGVLGLVVVDIATGGKIREAVGMKKKTRR